VPKRFNSPQRVNTRCLAVLTRRWHEHIKELVGQIRKTSNYSEKKRLRRIVDWMRSVQMAVIVSEEAGEEEKFKKQKLGIKSHRDRMNRVDEHGHDVEYNFKDAEHPLQRVFVCAMWLTGFDAPTVSTMYLDKPMKDHTLMPTIARANRVTSFRINDVEKQNGELVDYYNVFRNMKEALKNYARGEEGVDTVPVQEKDVLFQLLDDSIAQGMQFCAEREIDLEKVLKSKDVFKNVDLFGKYADKLLTKDEWRKAFAVYENTITSLFEACKPEIIGNPIVRSVAVFQYLRGVVDAIIEQKDIDAVTVRISELLDESVVVDGSTDLQQSKSEFVIKQSGKTWDLRKLDFEKLAAEFKEVNYKNIEIADLRAFIQDKLDQMMQQNATRADFAQRLQEIIDTYNSGSSPADNYFEELVQFAKDLKEESERHVREGLTEDELEIFDLLRKDKMTKGETQKVKLAAKSLLQRLLKEPPPVLIQDWFKDSQSKERVKSTVQEVLNVHLPESYDRALFTKKCDTVFELMLNYASQGLKWAA
jgi:type I restriction enzyme R subunit